MVRRLIVCYLLLFLRDAADVQLTFISLLVFLQVVYLIMYKPYKEMVVNWLAFVNELFTITAILTFYFFLRKHNTTEK